MDPRRWFPVLPALRGVFATAILANGRGCLCHEPLVGELSSQGQVS